MSDTVIVFSFVISIIWLLVGIFNATWAERYMYEIEINRGHKPRYWKRCIFVFLIGGPIMFIGAFGSDVIHCGSKWFAEWMKR